MSLRDRIFAVDDASRELVQIPEWNLEVEVRGMSGAARAALTEESVSNNGRMNLKKMMPEIVIGCTFDPETGEQVFSSEDAEAIMSKSGAALERITSVAMRLSGFGSEAVDEAGKGSSSTPSVGSSLS